MRCSSAQVFLERTLEDLRGESLYGVLDTQENEVFTCEQAVLSFIETPDETNFKRLFESRAHLAHISLCIFTSFVASGYMDIISELLDADLAVGLELIASTISENSPFNELYVDSSLIPIIIENLQKDDIPDDQVLLISKCVNNACRFEESFRSQVSESDTILPVLVDRFVSTGSVEIARALQSVIKYCDIDLSPLETMFVPLLGTSLTSTQVRCTFCLLRSFLTKSDRIDAFDNDEFAEQTVFWLCNSEDKEPVLTCITALTERIPVTVGERLVQYGLLEALLEIESHLWYVLAIMSNIAAISSDMCDSIVDTGIVQFIEKCLETGSFDERRLAISLTSNIMWRGSYETVSSIVVPEVVEYMFMFLEEENEQGKQKILDAFAKALDLERKGDVFTLHEILSQEELAEVIHDFVTEDNDCHLSRSASSILKMLEEL